MTPVARTLHFPKNRSIGTVLRRPANDPDAEWRWLGAALGDVSVSEHDVVQLRLGASATSPPKSLLDLPADSLHTLDLSGTWNTDSVLHYARHLSGLRSLNLAFTDVTDSGLMFVRALSRLCDLNLLGTPISDDGLAHIGMLSGLLTLGLAGTHVTGDGLLHLRGLTSLQSLYLMDTDVQDQGLFALSGLPSLLEIGLRNVPIDSHEMLHLRTLIRLHRLDLGNTRIDDEGLLFLRGLVLLERLDLDGTNIGNAGLRALHGLASLRRLDVSRTGATSTGLAALQGALPACRIYSSDGLFEEHAPQTRGELLDLFDEIIRAPITIAGATTELDIELSQNSWQISMGRRLAAEITVPQLIDFVETLARRKEEQINRFHPGHGMILYIWCDPVHGRLRLNLISDKHPHLPFGAVLFSTRPHEILDDFLASRSDEMRALTARIPSDAQMGDMPIPVYAVRLPRR
jgi:hypothetical protein